MASQFELFGWTKTRQLPLRFVLVLALASSLCQSSPVATAKFSVKSSPGVIKNLQKMIQKWHSSVPSKLASAVGKAYLTPLLKGLMQTGRSNSMLRPVEVILKMKLKPIKKLNSSSVAIDSGGVPKGVHGKPSELPKGLLKADKGSKTAKTTFKATLNAKKLKSGSVAIESGGVPKGVRGKPTELRKGLGKSDKGSKTAKPTFKATLNAKKLKSIVDKLTAKLFGGRGDLESAIDPKRLTSRMDRMIDALGAGKVSGIEVDTRRMKSTIDKLRDIYGSKIVINTRRLKPMIGLLRAGDGSKATLDTGKVKPVLDKMVDKLGGGSNSVSGLNPMRIMIDKMVDNLGAGKATKVVFDTDKIRSVIDKLSADGSSDNVLDADRLKKMVDLLKTD